ncbi:MAG: hypothetical protein ACTSUO_00810 [Candidatus Thorarchaeota archaeon]
MKELIRNDADAVAIKFFLEMEEYAKREEERRGWAKEGWEWGPSFETISERALKIGLHPQVISMFHKLKRRGLIKNVGSNKNKRWRLTDTEALKKMLLSYESKKKIEESIKEGEFTSEHAVQEFITVTSKLKKEFYSHLNKIHSKDVSEINDVRDVLKYMTHVFEDEEHMIEGLLPILQQYSLCDATIINEKEMRLGTTMFSMSYFGPPSAGKTFATDDLLRGSKERGIPPHAGYGLIRYSGGVTPPLLMRIAEAYKDWPIVLIVPEFNQWFSYPGMVEPLKLIMEGKEVEWQTYKERIGPYSTKLRLCTNYNTEEKGGRYTPSLREIQNFRAIDERTIVKYFLMDKKRSEWLKRNHMRLLQGKIDFYLSEQLRKHITFAVGLSKEYEIEVMLPDDVIEKIFSSVQSVDNKYIPRMTERAMKIAAASALIRLPSYIVQTKIRIVPDTKDVEIALLYLKEEIETRRRSGVW